MNVCTIDHFFNRKFNRENYNCLHFAREVWAEITGEDIGEKLDGLFNGPLFSRVNNNHPRHFVRLDGPKNPCLVLMQRLHSDPHTGVFIREGVLHITEIGVQYQSVKVASRGFKTVKFYA